MWDSASALAATIAAYENDRQFAQYHYEYPMKRTGSCQSIHALFRGLAIFLLATSPCSAEKLPYGASNLLQMLDELHCAANETEASRPCDRKE